MLASIAICSNNSADTLAAALDSALNQTLLPEQYEVLMVDDGSTDWTVELVAEYGKRHSNVRYLRLPVDRGIAAACNYALELAQGKYFVRLEPQDAFDRDFLAYCTEPLERGESDFACCDRYEVSLEDRVHRLVRVEPSNIFGLAAGGAVLRTDLMRAIRGYRSLIWEEYDLYLRYLLRSNRPPVRISRPLYYRCYLPSGEETDQNSAHEGWEELRRIWDKDVLKQFGWSGSSHDMEHASL